MEDSEPSHEGIEFIDGELTLALGVYRLGVGVIHALYLLHCINQVLGDVDVKDRVAKVGTLGLTVPTTFDVNAKVLVLDACRVIGYGNVTLITESTAAVMVRGYV